MRISGGEARGRSLTAAPGTRPTTDRIRQAIFNVLSSLVPLEGRALDLYAGSGALGIEALSRGMDCCDFVEIRGLACRAIKENLDRAGMTPRATVHCLAVASAIKRLEGPYRVVFTDPPYADYSALTPLAGLKSRLSEDCVIVLEHAGRSEPPPDLAALPLLSSKRYGDSAITFYARES